jgi:outer membrane protein TolC
MKKIHSLVFLLLVSFSVKSLAQESILGDINPDLLQKYIQSARENYALKKISDKRVEAAKTAIPIIALSYLDIANASYIFRPNNNTAIASPGVNSNPYAVNGLQFGLSVSLGSFIEKPFMIKRARLDYEIAKLDAQEFDNTLEIEVKTRYYNYVQNVAMLKISADNLVQITTIANGVRTKFQDGQVQLDVYDQSITAVSGAQSAKINAEIAWLKARDALEQIIGKKLADIK